MSSQELHAMTVNPQTGEHQSPHPLEETEATTNTTKASITTVIPKTWSTDSADTTPISLLHYHTLDEAHLSQYADEQLQRDIASALAVNEKRHALRIGVLLATSACRDTLVHFLPRLLSQCRLAAVTLLKSQNDDDNNIGWQREIQEWMKYSIGTQESHLNTTSRRSIQAEDPSLTVQLFHQEEGFQQMIGATTSTNETQQQPPPSIIDAVYIIVPTATQAPYVLQALHAGRHVLIHDPQSTALADYQPQHALAQEKGAFLQFSTMFSHYTRTQTFLESIVLDRQQQQQSQNQPPKSTTNTAVSPRQQQQNITRLEALLQVQTKDLGQCGVTSKCDPATGRMLWDNAQDSCIRRLARYCVLSAQLLLLSKDCGDCGEQQRQNPPIAVQVTHAKTEPLYNDQLQHKDETTTRQDQENSNHNSSTTEQVIIVQASGTVWFAQGQELSFQVGYNTANSNTALKRTRQVLEVHSNDRYATLNDFAISTSSCQHLSTYRVYQKKAIRCTIHKGHHGDDDHADTIEMTGGDAFDVMSGPPPNVMTWRNFAQLCRAVERKPQKHEQDLFEQERLREKARSLNQVAMQLKSILNHLEESFAKGCVRVPMKMATGIATTGTTAAVTTMEASTTPSPP